jgi:hypothetical protein
VGDAYNKPPPPVLMLSELDRPKPAIACAACAAEDQREGRKRSGRRRGWTANKASVGGTGCRSTAGREGEGRVRCLVLGVL